MFESDKDELSTKEACEALQAAASGLAYHKSTLDKLKSKIGFLGRTHAKSTGKTATEFALSKIPVVGSELKTAFNLGMQFAEEQYKKKKIDSLKHLQAEGQDVDEKLLLAELKHLTIDNCISKIDQSYKKVRMSLDEFNALPLEGKTCADFLEAFYHFYRVENRIEKLNILVDAVQRTLETLKKETSDQYSACQEYKQKLIERGDSFCKDHLGMEKCKNGHSSKFKDVCINDPVSLEKAGEKAKLLSDQG